MESLFPALMITYLSGFREVFSQPTWPYFQCYVFALLFVEGRKCTSRLRQACALTDKSLSSFQRFLSSYQWDLTAVMRALVGLLVRQLKEQLQVGGSYLLVVDTFLVAKASRKMLGVQRWHDHSSNPDRGKTMTGHHWSLAALMSRFQHADGLQGFLAWPVHCRLLSGQLNPCQFSVRPDGQARPSNFWDGSLALVFQMACLLGGLPCQGGPPLRVLVDAYFAKAPFFNALLEAGIHVLTRLRADAVGWDDPKPYSGRGRPAKRGQKWKLATLLKTQTRQTLELTLYGKKRQLVCVTRDVWLRDVRSKVRVVVVQTASQPLLWVSTDLTLNADQIISLYAARFRIELTIRDLKQHFGIGDYQCWTWVAIVRFVHLCCTSFCLWRLMLQPSQSDSWLEESSSSVVSHSKLSFARARRGLRRLVIQRVLFAKSAPATDLQKVNHQPERWLEMLA